MAQVIEIESLAHAALEPYARLTEAQLRSPNNGTPATFIAESPKVIERGLRAGYRPLSLLCERKHIAGDAAAIIDQLPADTPVYTGSRELLAALTGYTLTRGVLAAMQRPQPLTLTQVCHGAHRVAVLHELSDAANVGTIFRSAAALGIDAIVLTANSCDALNRRVVRTSMGAVFDIPWTQIDGNDSVAAMRQQGFQTMALALTDRSITLDALAAQCPQHLAIILGSEGWGLPQGIIDDADYTVRIPMSRGVDSLNVAAAAAIAFYTLAK